ncbi:hypothetical protein [Comamonas jiangduensis]|uniref:hypothetical protein n=1 Tax=Comamonas jiangduensis TaxID=1194168 RepID=UPI0028AC0AFB|nr:hypothetical protein [Comamonas jiangduensis]
MAVAKMSKAVNSWSGMTGVENAAANVGGLRGTCQQVLYQRRHGCQRGEQCNAGAKEGCSNKKTKLPALVQLRFQMVFASKRFMHKRKQLFF